MPVNNSILNKMNKGILRVFWCCIIFSTSLLFSVRDSAARTGQNEVVIIYTSVDQVFSEPILDLFEQRSGIRVLAVYDVEAAKTIGLVNRLIAERKRPKADVFWNSEVSRTIVLKNMGLLQPYFSPARDDIPDIFKDENGFWTGFACRARVMIYNTNLLKKKQLPSSLFDLTSKKWQGRVAMAYPLSGTTATHMGALYAYLGQTKMESYLQKLKDNQIMIVSGNSVVRDVVAAGEVAIGLTDTDDVLVAKARNKPVDMIFPDQQGIGTFLIPNSVAMIKDNPHPKTAKKIIDFLLSKEVEGLLAKSKSANIPVRKDVKAPEVLPPLSSLNIMQVDYNEAAGHIPSSDVFCRRLF